MAPCSPTIQHLPAESSGPACGPRLQISCMSLGGAGPQAPRPLVPDTLGINASTRSAPGGLSLPQRLSVASWQPLACFHQPSTKLFQKVRHTLWVAGASATPQCECRTDSPRVQRWQHKVTLGLSCCSSQLGAQHREILNTYTKAHILGLP